MPKQRVMLPFMSTFPQWAIFGPERSLSIPTLALERPGEKMPQPTPHDRKRVETLLEQARTVLYERPAAKAKLLEAALLREVQTVDDVLRHPDARGMMIAYEALRPA